MLAIVHNEKQMPFSQGFSQTHKERTTGLVVHSENRGDGSQDQGGVGH
jgi:hypothetical protein